MTLWFIFALMTAAAVFAILWPLARRTPRGRSGSELAVYRDQLDEVERDRAAGLIAEAEAEAARIEVSRRLLSAADAAGIAPNESRASSLWRRRAAALAALVMLPAGTAALYIVLGSPQLPGAMLSARLSAASAQRSIESMVAQIEAHLDVNPEDGRGWEVLGPVYLRFGRYDDAVKAYRNTLRLLGTTAARESDLGEAIVAVANGVVTAEAKAAFERAAAIDANNVKAQYFLGLAAEQDGKETLAAQIWRQLLSRAPADAAWRELVEASLARVDPRAVASGPTSSDMAAAEGLTAGQRSDMIRGMVGRLAERLKQDGTDIDGWMRLVRAYIVLGDRDKARAAATDARRALENDADKQRRLDDFVKDLGLES